MKLLLVALTLLISTSAFASDTDPAVGHWLTENERAVVQLKPCDDKLCGSIYWIIEGGMQFDEKNPNEELRSRKICGLQIVDSLEKDGEGEWENGNIYKADDGDTYSSELNIQNDGTLKVRGYLGVSWLGKTQIWARVDPADYKQCN